MSVDPLWAKYAPLQPYHYAGNEPVGRLDWDGRDIALVLSGPTGSLKNKETRWGLVGHIAIRIDNDVFYMDGEGKYQRGNAEGYRKFELSRGAGVVEVVLKNINETHARNFVESRTGLQVEYSLLRNSCVTYVCDALRAGGVEFNEPNGFVAPMELIWAFANGSGRERYGSDYKRYGEDLLRMSEARYREYILLMDESGLSRNNQPIISRCRNGERP